MLYICICLGIEWAEVNARQNLVIVKGTRDSKEVMDKIKKWWRKEVELVSEREDTNPQGYTVDEVNDEDEGEEEELLNSSFRHKDSSSRHEDSPPRHEDSRQKDSSARHKKFFPRMWGKNKVSSNAGEKNDNSESKASSQKEIPDHICKDMYCTFHKRENNKTSDPVPDHEPNKNHDANFSPLYHGSGSYHPMMNSHVQPPSMYAPPLPLRHRGQYYGPSMVPPMAGYGMPMPNGFTGYSPDQYNNGCNNM